MKFFVHLFILILIASPLKGQEFFFKQINVDAGLSHNLVFCTMQDEYGFIWFGTKDGLNRYDGYKMKKFRNLPGDKTSLGNNDVRALLCRSKNEIWVATRKGLFIFDVLKEQFREIERFKNSFVSSVLKDGNSVWVISNHDLYRISYNDTTKFRLPEGTISAICRLDNGHIWIGTTTGKIGLFNQANNNFTIKDAFEKTYRGSRWIEKVHEGYNNNLLIGTASAGLKSFNILKGIFKDILVYDNNAKPLYVRDILKNVNADEIWVATESGIYLFKSDNSIKSHITKDLKNSGGLTDNAIYALTSDGYGNIWIGTYFKGVCMYPRQSFSFGTKFSELKFENSNDELLFQNSVIREICQDEYDNIWMGTEDNGIYKLNNISKKIYHFTSSALPNALSYNNIHGMLSVNDTLWAGTFERGLDLINIKNGKVFQHFDRRLNNDLISNFIITFCKTKSNEIYIGTGRGLQRYNRHKKGFDIVDGIPVDFIYTLMESRNALIYIGTEDNGVIVYNPQLKQTVRLNNLVRLGVKLPDVKINCLFEDSNNNICIGTDGAGMFIYNINKQMLTHYNVSNGIPSNFIYKILQDNTGNIWCTTSVGMVQLNSLYKVLKIFTKENGLPSNQFNYNSGFLDKNGNIYFGSTSGLVYFSPGNNKSPGLKIPLYFTGLNILGKEIALSDTASPLKISLLSSDSLTLDYNQSTFSIDFSAPIYSFQNDIVYSYRLAGVEDKWTPIKESRTIYFTRLPKGSYKLQVTAVSPYDKSYTSATKTLHITILPPFWQSQGAYIFYTLAAIAILYILVQYYHNYQKKINIRKLEELNHRRETEINQAQIEFFTNIAHEIKTPLTLIQGPVEDLMNSFEKEGHPDYELKLIEKNTNRLLELTNQLLDFRKIESNNIQVHPSNINLYDLTREVYDNFKIAARNKNLDYRLTIKDKDSYIHSERDFFTKILYNLFSNGIKYSESSFEIILYPTDTESRIRFEFINDGTLIPEEAFSKIFQPFYRFEKNKIREGSGIGLSFAYSLVRLLKGSLTVSVSSSKNIFTLTIPTKF